MMDDAIQLVGRSLYAGDWIGELSERERWLIGRYIDGSWRDWSGFTISGPTISYVVGGRHWAEVPGDPALMAEADRARDRRDWMNAQYEAVFDWLENRGFDPDNEHIDETRFERAFAECFKAGGCVGQYRNRFLSEIIPLGEAAQEVYENYLGRGGLVPAIRVLVAILTTGRAGRARALLDGKPGEIDPGWWPFGEADLSSLTLDDPAGVCVKFELPGGRVICATEISLNREAWREDLLAAIRAIPKRFPEQDAWEHRALPTTDEERIGQDKPDQFSDRARATCPGGFPERSRLSGTTAEICGAIRRFLLKQGSGSERELLPALRELLPGVPRKLFRDVRDDLTKKGLFSKPQRGAPRKQNKSPN